MVVLASGVMVYVASYSLFQCKDEPQRRDQAAHLALRQQACKEGAGDVVVKAQFNVEAARAPGAGGASRPSACAGRHEFARRTQAPRRSPRRF